MKIELNSPAVVQPAVEKSTRQVVNTSTPAIKPTTEDRITFRSDATSVRALTNQALNQPEIRQSRVEALRGAVTSEQYQYNSTRTAAAIVGHDVQ